MYKLSHDRKILYLILK